MVKKLDVKKVITQDYLKSVVSYNPIDGSFVWKFRTDVDPEWNKRWAGKRAGSKMSHGYYRVCINYTAYTGHALAWFYMTGEWPTYEVDHINMDRADNRFCNLRLANQYQNSNNRGKNRNNTSGHKCVFWHKKAGKWTVTIVVNGEKIYLGLYESLDKAVEVSRAAIHKYSGEFARAA